MTDAFQIHVSTSDIIDRAAQNCQASAYLSASSSWQTSQAGN